MLVYSIIERAGVELKLSLSACALTLLHTFFLKETKIDSCRILAVHILRCVSDG